MKHRWILLLVGILFLAGCSSEWAGTQDDGYKEVVKQIGSMSWTLYPKDTSHYLLQSREDDEILCWVEGCHHMTRECPAYYRSGTYVLDEDKDKNIYLLEAKDTQYDGAQMGTLIVWCVDPSEHVKEKVAEYQVEGITVARWQGYCLYNETLYAQGKCKDGSNCFVELNVKNGKGKQLLTVDGDVRFIGVDEEALYWTLQSGENWRYVKKSESTEKI